MWRTMRKMNRREAINAGIAKFGFKETQENQQKVVEAYIGGQNVLMVPQTGSGKGLMFHIAPLVLDFYKNGEWNLADRVCLVSFPLVWLMKDQVSILHEKVLGTETSKRENKDASKEKFNLVFTSPKALFGSHRSSILALKNKFQCGDIHMDSSWDSDHPVIWGLFISPNHQRAAQAVKYLCHTQFFTSTICKLN